jgi:PAS domain S-box-containing protein
MPSTSADHLIDLDAVAQMSRPELEAHAKALRTISAITEAVLSAADPREALGPAVQSILRFTRFPAVALYTLDAAAQRFEIVYSSGFDEAALRVASPLPLEGSITGEAVRRREIILVPDLSRDPRVEPVVREHLAGEGCLAAAMMPLFVGQRAVGAMNLIYKGELGLTQHERGLLAAIGDAMAMALERATFVRTIERERQRSEAALRSIGEAILTTDELGRVTFMNPEAERLTAWTQREALNHPVEDVFRIHDAKTRETVESPVARSLREHEVVHLQVGAVLATRDGLERDVSDTSSAIVDARGKAWGAVLAFQDVTQARRDSDWLAFLHDAGQLLACSLDYETTLAQVARLAVVSLADVSAVDIVQPDGSIRRLAGAHTDPAKQSLLDAAFRRARLDPDAPGGTPRAIRTREPVLYSLSRTDGPQAGTTDLAGGADPEFIEALRALEIRSALAVPLLVGRRALGALALGSRAPQWFKESDVQRAQQLAHCCTSHIENARLHRELRDALAVRDEFLSLASHELRTPLTSLQLNLAALEKAQRSGEGGDPAMAAKLARAVQQSTRLAKLHQNIIDVAMLSGGSMTLQLEEVDLRALVADAAEQCRDATSRVELRPGPPVVVRFDKARIAQAVSNLIANAIKFGEGRPIELIVEPNDDGTARITVTDQGIGVAAKDTTRIFELFERAVPSRHYGGLGLGLYVAREIVRAHGGSILVSSEPEAGSTFTILLPRRA